jgi:uncharacterized membrane protein YkvA (DUF1232 family)
MSTAKSVLAIKALPELEETSNDFYQKLRRWLRGEALMVHLKKRPNLPGAYRALVESLSLFPDFFHLTVSLLLDKRVPAENKGALVAVLIYVLSPLDFLPDIIPVSGWVDDMIVVIIGLNKFLETDNPAIKTAVQRHWAGSGEVFAVVKHLISIADEAVEFLPKKLMRMMKDIFKG